MGAFRDLFLRKLLDKPSPVGLVDLTKFEAFSRKDLETAIQIYRHLKARGHTFDDLILRLEHRRQEERRNQSSEGLKAHVSETRDQYKRRKSMSRKDITRRAKHG